MDMSREPISSEPSPLADRIIRSVPSGSRRDLIRAGAILAAGGAIAPRLSLASPAPRSNPSSHAQDGTTTLTLAFNPFGQTLVLDPHRAPNWGPFWVLFPHLWSGLLGFDENGAVILDLAESFEPNETADVWTATIRPDLTFASGSPVDAEAFIASWKRALDPNQPAPMSTFFADVEGYAAFVAGESAEIGFVAVDDLTIEITLSRPFSSFPAAVATFGWVPLDLPAIEDEPDALAMPGIGMWNVVDFQSGVSMTMEPHPTTPTPVSASIASIVWQMVEGSSSAESTLSMYQEDLVPIADATESVLEEIQGDDALNAELVTIASSSSTLAIGLDFNQAPFNDLRYRRAVASAVDRATWAETIQGGAFTAADSLVPPAIVATANYEPATAIAFDANAAQNLLADADYDPETADFEVVYHQAASDSVDEIDRTAALLAMITENSGLEIRHDTSLTSEQITRLYSDNGGRQFDLVWWWADTDTPSFIANIAAPGSPAMDGLFNWSDDLEHVEDQAPGEDAATFTTLIDEANQTVDEAERNSAFQQAEQLVLDDAVLIPLGHWVQRFVQKPWLTGTRQGPWSGSIPVRFDEAVTFSPPSGNE